MLYGVYVSSVADLVARQIKSIFNKNHAFSETSMKFGM